MLNQCFTSSPLFGLGYISVWKINAGVFITYWLALPVLAYVSVLLSYLCSSYLIFLSTSPYTERAGPLRLDHNRLKACITLDLMTFEVIKSFSSSQIGAHDGRSFRTVHRVSQLFPGKHLWGTELKKHLTHIEKSIV